MPRAFDTREQTSIRESLQEAGARLFRAKGVLKTTIDDLASAAGVAKGSFYKFYDSKELLFFEILEGLHERLRAPLLMANKDARSRRHFEKLLRKLLLQISEEPLILFMGREDELQAVLRRVKPERLRDHERKDQAFIDNLIASWTDRKTPPSRDVVAARLTAVLLVCLRRDFVGKRLFPLALDAGVESLANCFFEPE